jgi:hypothetical protein
MVGGREHESDLPFDPLSHILAAFISIGCCPAAWTSVNNRDSYLSRKLSCLYLSNGESR